MLNATLIAFIIIAIIWLVEKTRGLGSASEFCYMYFWYFVFFLNVRDILSKSVNCSSREIIGRMGTVRFNYNAVKAFAL